MSQMNAPSKKQAATRKFQNNMHKPYRRRKRIKQPAGHPTDEELIASWSGTVKKLPDGLARESLASTDQGLNTI